MWVRVPVTAEETDLEPGPDGKLISTEERLEQVRQREADVPKSIQVEQQGETGLYGGNGEATK